MQDLSRSKSTVDSNKYLKSIKLSVSVHTCATCSKLPSNISNMLHSFIKIIEKLLGKGLRRLFIHFFYFISVSLINYLTELTLPSAVFLSLSLSLSLAYSLYLFFLFQYFPLYNGHPRKKRNVSLFYDKTINHS